MKRTRTIRSIAVAGSALALVGGGTMAGAKSSHHSSSARSAAAAGQCPGPARGGPPFIRAAADYLGVDVKTLLDDFKSGKTLADVAGEQGKSVDGLKDAIYNDAQTHLDQAVKDGKISSDQEQTMLDRLKSHLDDIVNKVPP